MTKTVSLKVGSGGALGLAHIGVIRELEENGYQIGSIIGCSMGALIGGFYAAGKLADFESWVTTRPGWDVLRFLDISLANRWGADRCHAARDAATQIHEFRHLHPIAFTGCLTPPSVTV